jgi:CBS-domain-containing membrane protein
MAATVTVRQMMSSPVVSATPHAALQQAIAQMDAADVGHLPVLEGDGHLVGLVSRRDVTRALELERAAEGKRPGLLLIDIMRTEVQTIGPDEPAHEAARLLLERRIGSVVVVDDAERPIGLVTSTDFIGLARRALLDATVVLTGT